MLSLSRQMSRQLEHCSQQQLGQSRSCPLYHVEGWNSALTGMLVLPGLYTTLKLYAWRRNTHPSMRAGGFDVLE